MDEYAAIICPIHGTVFLTQAEYNRQMDKPDSIWKCPKFETHKDRMGLCGQPSEFDDDFWERKR
jgi:hypothetical protein